MEYSSQKVAIVVNTAWNIVNFRLGLIKGLLKEGYQVVAIAPPDEFVAQIEATGCQFIPLKRLERKGTNPLKDFLLMRELQRIYKKEKIDIALQYTIKPNIYGSFAASFTKTKVICTVTGLGYSFLSTGWINRIVKRLYKAAFRRALYVAFQNEDDQQLFIDTGLAKAEKTLLIKGSGINTTYFCPLEKTENSDDFVFLFVGRLLFDKGVKELLEAAAVVKSKQSKVTFWLVGALDEGNPSCVSKELIDQYEKDGTIHYFGSSKAVREIMRNADAVVLPSYREGLPRVMLEALSMAKPVITTDAPGCRATVQDGKNGFMVPVKDSIALQHALMKLLELTTEERQAMGDYGRQIALNEFAEERIVEQYQTLLATILAKK